VIKVCYNCECFTWINDTTCLSVREEFTCSNHDTYSFSNSNGKREDFFSLEKGVGFEYIPPKLTNLPEKGKETATGKDYRKEILKVFDAEHIQVDKENEVVSYE